MQERTTQDADGAPAAVTGRVLAGVRSARGAAGEELGGDRDLLADLSGPAGPGIRVREAPAPRDLLERLVVGDPLGLRGLARDELARRALLWDADALARKALARVAWRAGAEGRRRLGGAFARACLDGALADLDRPGADDPDEARDFERLGLALGFDGAAVARACRAHNRMGAADRLAFRRLVVEGADLDATAHELGLDASSLVRAARRVLERFFVALRSPAGAPDVFLGNDAPGGAHRP